jgi:hypothetical protein
MSEQAQRDAGIFLTTIRISVGMENPKQLIGLFLNAVRLTIDPARPGFSDGFMSESDIDHMCEEIYLESHRKFVQGSRPMASFL